MLTAAKVGPHSIWPYCPVKFRRPVWIVRFSSLTMNVSDSHRALPMKRIAQRRDVRRSDATAATEQACAALRQGGHACGEVCWRDVGEDPVGPFPAADVRVR